MRNGIGVGVRTALSLNSKPVVAGGTTYVLDGLAVSCQAAVGFKKLSSSYSGNVVRLKNITTGNFLNVGLSGDNFDTAAANAFNDGGDTIIVTWFDQSGNGNDFTTASDAASPKLYVSGVLQTNANGDPAALFDGTDDLISSPSLTHNSVYGRFQSNNPIIDDRGVFFGFNTGAVYAGRWDQGGTGTDINFAITGTNFRVDGVDFVSGVNTLDQTFDAVNGTPGALVVGSAAGVGETSEMRIGGLTSGGSRMVDGLYDCVLSFATDNSTSERATIESRIAAL